MKWKKATLKEIVSNGRGLIQTGPFGSQLHRSDYTDEGTPVIMPTDIFDGRVMMDRIARINEETAERLSRHKLKPRTIVLPRRGEITKRAFIRDDQEGWLCGSGCLKIETQDTDVLPEFLYYYMARHEAVQWLEQHAVGSTMLNLSAGIVNEMPVLYPEKLFQEKIADVLSTYDDLIENNRRRMELLEQAARLLYQEWFVRLRFPGHEHTKIIKTIPQGWESARLGECVTLNYGKALRSDERVDGPFPVYGSSGIVGSHEKPLTNGPGIILGRKGNVGSVFWSSKDFFAIDTVYFVDAPTSNLYLYYALKNMHFISTDVAVPGLNRDLAYSRPVLVPSKKVLRDFLEIVTPVHEQLDKLDEINQKLRSARDLLLPRLISGEIIV